MLNYQKVFFEGRLLESMKWEGYDKKFYQNPDSVLQMENEYLLSLILDLNPKDKKTLDFGCGLGHWIEVLSASGAIVSGTDISDEAIDICRAKYPKCKFECAGENIPFRDQEFDLILVSWVFQEIIDDHIFQEVIKEIVRCLAANGKLIITDNVYPDSRKIVKVTPFGDIFENKDNIPSNLRFFPYNSVHSILKQYGLILARKEIIGESFFEVYQFSL